MPRNLDSTTQTQVTVNAVNVAFLCQLQFTTGTAYTSTLPTNITWNSQTWTGVGSFGQVGTISEGTDIQAYGTSVTLSGIDPTLLADCLDDINVGYPATLYLAFFDSSLNILGTPTVIFDGIIGQPTITPSTKSITITLALESPLINLQRGSFRRYTSADQHIDNPGDIGFDWIPSLNFMALRWGQPS